MTPLSTTPAFNLKVVLKETGIRPDTLRAWERRYGLPKPQRSAGGHRLYSQRDIETIKWLMARQEEGLSIARAIELFRSQIAQGNDPLEQIEPPPSQPITTPGTLESLRQEWVDACLAFDEKKAEGLLNQAFALFPLETVITDILQYAMIQVCDQWYQNDISVQQEHFASALVQRRLNSLIAACPAPTRSEVILIANPPNEQHLIPILMLNLFLRRRGFGVVDLGANVPIAKFDETVGRIKPHLVILSSQRLSTVAAMLEVILSLHPLKTQIAYGGRIFNLLPRLVELIPAHYLGKTLDEAVRNIERLVSQRPPLPTPPAVLQTYHQTAEVFRHHRPQLEARLFEGLGKYALPEEYLRTAIEDFSDVLHSALAIGDLDAIQPELEWLRGLLHQHHLPDSILVPFLLGYAQALQSMGTSQLAPLIDWLRTTAERVTA
jgi:methanogenic corrinoid protein MtbC1